jgi:hypothetical protein
MLKKKIEMSKVIDLDRKSQHFSHSQRLGFITSDPGGFNRVIDANSLVIALLAINIKVVNRQKRHKK